MNALQIKTASAEDIADRQTPDMGAVLAGAPHPTEKEIRRKERPAAN